MLSKYGVTIRGNHVDYFKNDQVPDGIVNRR